jgi:S-adenosylmethionine hydrolase
LKATIALLTDFGIQDPFVGMMKGVIARIAPHAHIIDLTHSIPQGDVFRGAFELWRSVSYFPQQTIFVAVVDPGVGTTRRPIALAWPEKICVGPDNGIFTYLLATNDTPTSVVLETRSYHLEVVSNTFHGRDIFAPVAAHLARGIKLTELGSPTNDFLRLPFPKLELIKDCTVQGEILHADRFGNLITSIGILQIQDSDILLQPWLPHCQPTQFHLSTSRIRIPNGELLKLSLTYSDVPRGELVAYIGSAGMLEIAINQERAVDILQHTIGQKIQLSDKG